MITPSCRRLTALAALACAATLVTGCSPGGADTTPGASQGPESANTAPSQSGPTSQAADAAGFGDLLPGMPPPLSPTDIYAADTKLSPKVAGDRDLIYVPNSHSASVSVIDPRTMKVIDTFPVGRQPQHVVPSYDLQTLYVTSDLPLNAGSLTPIDPKTGKPGKRIPVKDPYNLYFTPDGKYAIVVSEAFKELNFYDPHTWKLEHTLELPQCAGVDHMDFTANGRKLIASCEFAGKMAVVDVSSLSLVRMITLPGPGTHKPQDVKLSPDGKTFYVADMDANGIFTIDGNAGKVTGFIPTGKGTHGLYVTRDSRHLLITNRGEGSISVLDFATGKLVDKWHIPGGGSPDMGNLSADGKVFWVSGRYNGVVYAIDTSNGHLIEKIPVGAGPHGLTVWPQPGRYSTGHTGVMR